MSQTSKTEAEWINIRFGKGIVLAKLGERITKSKNRIDKLSLMCDCGTEYTAYSDSLVKGSNKSCGCLRRKDLTNQRFGYGVVTSYSHSEKKSTSRNSVVFWNLLCNCGNQYKATTNAITSGDTSSCGCIKTNFHCVITPRKFSRWWKAQKQNYRRYEFNLTEEYVISLLESQNFLCKLSGLPITVEEGNASLDRIDSTKGYIEGNVQFVHKTINFMKNTMSQDEFIRFCGLVFYYNHPLRSEP